MPHLVEMHNEYANDGLAAVTFNIDAPADAKAQEGARNFLQSTDATTINLALAPGEDADDWYDNKLKLDGLPGVWVYNRAGQRVKDFGYDPEGIEKYVVALLKQK